MLSLFSKRQNFKLVPTGSIDRQQNKYCTNIKSILEHIENVMEEGQNASYQHHLLLQKYFQSQLLWVVKPCPNNKFYTILN